MDLLYSNKIDYLPLLASNTSTCRIRDGSISTIRRWYSPVMRIDEIMKSAKARSQAIEMFQAGDTQQGFHIRVTTFFWESGSQKKVMKSMTPSAQGVTTTVPFIDE
jgi:hypothetical protein